MPDRVSRLELGRRAGSGLPRDAAAVLGGIGPEAIGGLRETGHLAAAALAAGGRSRRRSAVPDTEALATMAGVIERRTVPESPVGVNLFGTAPDPTIADRQVEFMQTLAAGTLYLSAAPDLAARNDPRIDALIDIALSEAPEDLLRRDILLGGLRKPSDPGSLGKRIPDRYLALAEQLRQKGCLNAAKQAVGQLGAAMGQSAPRYRPASIAELDPVDCCPGDTITIRGSGFGVADEAAVAFTSATGKAVLVPAGSPAVQWSDTEIVLTVPPDARHGPVGVLTVPQPSGNIGSLAGRAVGEMGACFGPMAMAQAEALFGNMRPPTAGAPRAQVDGNNIFTGGIPVVRSFSASPSIYLGPNTTVTLSWRVEGATSVTIEREQVGTDQHELPAVAGTRNPHGSATVGPVPGTRDWKGRYVLVATNHCGTERRPLELTMAVRVGLALGGGGSRGDFQVGALRYLYDVKGVRPNAIAATSVGAINAIDLVQGDTAAGNGAARVEAQWRLLVDDHSMWNYEPWLAKLSASAREIVKGFSWTGLMVFPYTLVKWIGAGGAIKEVVDAFSSAQPPNAIYNIQPIKDRLSAAFDPALAANSGIALRLIAVSLETGEVVSVDETGSVHGIGALGQTASVIDGAMASAAMPAIFPPVQIGLHMCVDGGVREVVPIETVIRELGANRVFAIRLSAPPAPEPFTPNRGMAAIAARAVLSTTFDEVADDDVAPFGGWGEGREVHVIESTFDIHDPTVVDPGLIDIGINYGWMRASDVLDVAPTNRVRARWLADEITRLRTENWELAHRALKPARGFRPRFGFSTPSFVPSAPQQVTSPPLMSTVQLVRRNSTTIRDHVRERVHMSASCRTPVEPWFQGWETIPFAPHTPNPWVEYDGDPSGILPAAPMPVL